MKRFTNLKDKTMGSKASNLSKMLEHGLPVPAFSVFQFDFFKRVTTQEYLTVMQEQYETGELSLSGLSETLIAWLTKQLEESNQSDLELLTRQSGKYFSVRSSATVEDEARYSFAGQFETLLYVSPADLPQAVKKVLTSLFQTHSLAYLLEGQIALADAAMNIIVQDMVPGTLSGVYFTANPQGILNEHIVVVGKGIGSDVVEDKVPTTMITIHPTDQLSYMETTQESPIPTGEQIKQLTDMAQQVTILFGPAMDIEFTFAEGKLYVLQARSITTLSGKSSVILDNSNIVESYPGTTTPLTYSFIQEAYTSVFRGLGRRVLGRDLVALSSYETTFNNMIAMVNSRVYYQIHHWYQLLQLLPFASQVIPIWQNMLGVRETSIPPMPVHLSRWQRVKIIRRILLEFKHAPQKMEQLEHDFQQVTSLYQTTYSSNASFDTLHQLFKEIKKQVLDQWDITLVNDLYAFVYTGFLGKLSSNQNVLQEMAGIDQIESMKPAHALAKIVHQLRLPANKNYIEQIKHFNTKQLKYFLETDSQPLTQQISHYLLEYGNRVPNELKLETKTYASHPSLFISLLEQQLAIAEKTATLQAKDVVEHSQQKITRNPLVNFVKKRALIGIKLRESSRLNRTRIYGMMRTIFVTMGERLLEQDKIKTLDDIFYLSLEELFALSIGEVEEDTRNRQMIEERRRKDKLDQELPAFSRLIFEQEIIEKHPHALHSSVTDIIDEQSESNYFRGIGCSSGRISGEVVVITDIQSVSPQAVHQKIIVAKMTDPGWVHHLSQAKGIITERGSLLSHTAIVSRELKIPSVVNVAAITRQLKSGDRVEIDGQSGYIRRMEGDFDDLSS